MSYRVIHTPGRTFIVKVETDSAEPEEFRQPAPQPLFSPPGDKPHNLPPN